MTREPPLNPPDPDAGPYNPEPPHGREPRRPYWLDEDGPPVPAMRWPTTPKKDTTR